MLLPIPLSTHGQTKVKGVNMIILYKKICFSEEHALVETKHADYSKQDRTPFYQLLN